MDPKGFEMDFQPRALEDGSVQPSSWTLVGVLRQGSLLVRSGEISSLRVLGKLESVTGGVSDQPTSIR